MFDLRGLAGAGRFPCRFGELLASRDYTPMGVGQKDNAVRSYPWPEMAASSGGARRGLGGLGRSAEIRPRTEIRPNGRISVERDVWDDSVSCEDRRIVRGSSIRCVLDREGGCLLVALVGQDLVLPCQEIDGLWQEQAPALRTRALWLASAC